MITALLPKLTVTGKEISSLVWNPEIYYRLNKTPPLSSILSRVNTTYSLIPFSSTFLALSSSLFGDL
jgi:hypothetical protein